MKRALLAASALLLSVVAASAAPFYDAMPTIQSGSVGTDYSANAPVVTFGSAPTYTPQLAGYVVLTAMPASNARAGCRIMNLSANSILEILDDGAGGTPTVFVLDPGSAVGKQGGSDTCDGFKGRITVMSTSSGDRVSMRSF